MRRYARPGFGCHSRFDPLSSFLLRLLLFRLFLMCRLYLYFSFVICTFLFHVSYVPSLVATMKTLTTSNDYHHKNK